MAADRKTILEILEMLESKKINVEEAVVMLNVDGRGELALPLNRPAETCRITFG